MRIPTSRLVRFAGSAAVIGAVGGATLGATTLLGLTFKGGSGAEVVGGVFLTDNRDRLAVCVQEVSSPSGAQPAEGDSAVVELAKSRIQTVLPEITMHPAWIDAGLNDTPDPVVDIGCAAQPALYGASLYPDSPPAPLNAQGRVVSEASYYKVFVFILPPDEVERITGGSPSSSLRLSREEYLCEGDVCSQVTTGLYLSPDDLQDSAFLVDALEKAIGLEPPF